MRLRHLLLAGALAIGSAAYANDAPGPGTALDAAEALAVDAQHYAASYGVGETEAMRRLLIMHGTREQALDVERRNEANLSGMFFDNGADFGLKVRVVGDAAPANAKLVKKATKVADKAERLARRTARKALRERAGITDAAVEAAEDLLSRDQAADVKFLAKGKEKRADREARIEGLRDDLKRVLPSLEMLVDDEKAGQAVVYVRSDPGDAEARAERVLGIDARVEVVPSGLVDTHTRGGSIITRRSDNALFCMTGFVARRVNVTTEQLGVFTAGHCVNGTPLNYTDRDGSSYALEPVPGMTVNGSTADLAFMTANHVAVNQFYADNTSTPRTLTAAVTRSGTRVRSSTVNGSYICHLGQTSPTDQTLMQSCGEVTSVNGSRTISGTQQGNTFVVVTNTQSGAGTTRETGKGTLRCVPGDSGGAWFAHTTAYGIQSQCGFVDEPARTITRVVVYTSIEYIAPLGAELVF